MLSDVMSNFLNGSVQSKPEPAVKIQVIKKLLENLGMEKNCSKIQVVKNPSKKILESPKCVGTITPILPHKIRPNSLNLSDSPLKKSSKSNPSGHRRQFRYFINLTLLTQGNEENGTRETLLFTISNSWPISFGKDSF